MRIDVYYDGELFDSRLFINENKAFKYLESLANTRITTTPRGKETYAAKKKHYEYLVGNRKSYAGSPGTLPAQQLLTVKISHP